MSLDAQILAAMAPRKRIIALAAEAFGVPHAELVGSARSRQYVIARHAAAWAIRRAYPATSFPQIGAMLGGRDHSTIMHGMRSIEERMKRDPALRAMCEALAEGRIAEQFDTHVAAWHAEQLRRREAAPAALVDDGRPGFAERIAAAAARFEKSRAVKPKNALSPDDDDAVRRSSGTRALSEAIAAAGGWRS